jgi:hypothetical protein
VIVFYAVPPLASLMGRRRGDDDRNHDKDGDA